MKRRITPEQLAELTEEQKDRLREWWKPEIGDLNVFFENQKENVRIVLYAPHRQGLYLPLLDIGQCIDLLDNFVRQIDIYQIKEKTWTVVDAEGEVFECGHKELIDALWEAVKSVL
jgi:hypothetical protein